MGSTFWTKKIPNSLIPNDKYAVKVVKSTETVGHVPRAISPYINYILANGEKVEVIGSRQNRRGNGLEVPGLYKIKGPYVATEKGIY